MILRLILLSTFIYFASTQTPIQASPKEDLQEEYYTVASIDYRGEVLISDDDDAQKILDSYEYDRDFKQTMVGIYLYRDKIRRNCITDQICEKRWKGYFKYTSEYEVQRQQYFTDFIFSLYNDENFVLSKYLGNFFGNKLEKFINIAMVLAKDLQAVIKIYGPDLFKTARKSQREPFEHMLRVWVRENRELLANDDPAPDTIKRAADDLKKEQDDGGWHENRDQIELITMKKSIKFARAVIAEFEKLNGGKALEDIITENIKTCGLDENLADTYASLALYIKSKPKYIARILAENSNGSDEWAAWFLCIAVVHPPEWPKIDEAFKKNHNGVSLSKFITGKLTTDKILAEAMAVAVDPKYKPTSFKEIPPIFSDSFLYI